MAANSPADVGALENARAVVRVPAMRSSGHLVPTSLAPVVLPLARPSAAARAYRRRQGGLDEARDAELRERVLALAREPLSRPELRAALGAEVAAMDAEEAARSLASLPPGGGGREAGP